MAGTKKKVLANVVQKPYRISYLYKPRTEEVFGVFYAESPEAAKLRLMSHLTPGAEVEILDIREEVTGK